jgi:peptidoglycan/xylan/chitin deacetylase (PgdA/CDA1 family)
MRARSRSVKGREGPANGETMRPRTHALALLAVLAIFSTSSPAASTDGQRSAERCPSGVSGTTRPVPILMYHVIADPPPGAPYPDLFVSSRRFAEEVRLLAQHGYRGVTLDRVWAHWHRCAPLPAKPVVVSFDDGFSSWHRVAYPVLSRHGWVGTMNLALSHLNGIDVRRRWVRKLILAGWELDSHTLTHPDLTELGALALRREVAGSRRRLRRIFAVPVHFFCYPAGRYNARVIDAVRAAGYFGATTTLEGLATPESRFTLRRVRVNRSDTPADLLRRVGGG